MKRKIIGMGILALLIVGKVWSQVSIDGEWRPRTEFRQGFRKPLLDSLNPALVVLQRTRLSFDYKSKLLNARINLQDSRVWGQSDTKSSGSSVQVYEAWAELLLTSGFSVQFGRQPLKYDDQRLFGASAWSNTGLAHDILLFKFKPGKSWQAHTGLAYNNVKDTLMELNYTIPKMYKTMGFAWISKSLKSGLSLSAIAVEEGLQRSSGYASLNSRFTGGVNLVYANDSCRFSFIAAGYYQKGKDFSENDLEAYMASAKAGYRFYKKNTVALGFDYFSGTGPDAHAGTSSTFNKLYGSNHGFNGNMEYWATLPKSGLVNGYGTVGMAFTPKLGADLTLHTFFLAEDYLVSNKKINKFLGSEFDVVINYTMSKEVALQGGYCMYFDSGATKKFYKMSGLETRQPVWAYVMLTIKPNLYKTPVSDAK
jgi:hypothetical protein